MPKMCCLKKKPLMFISVLIMAVTYGPRCEASLFSNFINHVAGQAKAVIKAPVKTIDNGIKHELGKIEEGVKSVAQNLKEAGDDSKKGQGGNAVLHTVEASITAINTTSKVLGPLGEVTEGGAVAILSSQVSDAVTDTAINLAIQKLPEEQQEPAQKAKEGAEAARTAAEVLRK